MWYENVVFFFFHPRRRRADNLFCLNSTLVVEKWLESSLRLFICFPARQSFSGVSLSYRKPQRFFEEGKKELKNFTSRYTSWNFARQVVQTEKLLSLFQVFSMNFTLSFKENFFLLLFHCICFYFKLVIRNKKIYVAQTSENTNCAYFIQYNVNNKMQINTN